MKKDSFINAVGVLVYIVIVSTVMRNVERLFGEMDDYIGPVAFLLLLTLSAVIVGGLVLGKPIVLYLDGKKKEAVGSLFQTILWLAVFTVITITIAALIK